MSAPRPDVTKPAFKISALSERSGVSKELIHHYLREGLLPRPTTRAQYDELHLRLLGLIKRLRDERFLPLARIRSILAFHDFDPDRVELMLLADSDLIAEAAPSDAALPDGIRMSLRDLETRTGIDRESLDRYVSLGLLRPSGVPARSSFRRHDVNLAALVHRGVQMGIPLDSFRTIRSHIELAFELEQRLFIPADLTRRDLAEVAGEYARRKEVINGFVVHVLTGLVDSLLYRYLDEAPTHARLLEEAIYQPSDAFLRLHGVLDQIEALRTRLGRHPTNPQTLLCLLRSFAFCARHREAIFVAERALVVVPGQPEAMRLHAWSLFLHGESDRGAGLLERAHAANPGDPVCTMYLAAAAFARLGAAGSVESTLRAVQKVINLVLDALGNAHVVHGTNRIDLQLLGGWILTSLVGARDLQDQGIHHLTSAFEASSPDAPGRIELEAERLRCRITAAFLLARALASLEPASSERGDRLAALRAEVLCTDPASDFAARMFLQSCGPRGPAGAP